jgi:DNA replication protein DnaC
MTENPISSSTCPECGDTGWVIRESHNRRGAVPCGCQKERKIAAALPERYRQARLSDFPAQIVEGVTAWFAKPGDGLLLCGPAGTGKTHLAAAITRACIEIGKPIMFRRAADLFQAIRETYDQGFTEEGVLAEYAKARLLVLDDLGAGALTDFERRYTLEVLDRRLNAMLPTIVTTNWTLPQIKEQMDERIASRLSSFTLLAFAGRDRRERKNVTKQDEVATGHTE